MVISTQCLMNTVEGEIKLSKSTRIQMSHGPYGVAFEPRLVRLDLFAISVASLDGILEAFYVPGNIKRHATKELQIYLVPIKGNQRPAIKGVSQGGLGCND